MKILIGGLIGLGIFGWGFFTDSTAMVVIGALLYAFAGLILHVHRRQREVVIRDRAVVPLWAKEVPVEDMIRGIHYDIDPRSESLRTPK